MHRENDGIQIVQRSRGLVGLVRFFGGIPRFFRVFFFGRRLREGLGLWRFCMVLAGFAPLFILLALRGNALIPDRLMWYSCIVLVVVPILSLLARLAVVYATQNPRDLTVGRIEDSRSHVLVYVFALLLPLYSVDIVNYRDGMAILAALIFVIFLFWHMNLHYLNFVLALFGFRMFTTYPPDAHNQYENTMPITVITRQPVLLPNSVVKSYRLSNTLFWVID